MPRTTETRENTRGSQKFLFQTPSGGEGEEEGEVQGSRHVFGQKFTKSEEISGELLIKDPSLGGGVGSNMTLECVPVPLQAPLWLWVCYGYALFRVCGSGVSHDGVRYIILCPPLAEAGGV